MSLNFTNVTIIVIFEILLLSNINVNIYEIDEHSYIKCNIALPDVLRVLWLHYSIKNVYLLVYCIPYYPLSLK